MANDLEATTKRSTLPSYIMPDTHLSMGPSLGNSAVWVTTKGTGTIERVFNARVGESLFGAVSVRYALVVGSHVTVQRDTNESSSIPLQGDAGTIEVHPAYQRRRFSLGKDLRVCETTFVPLGDTRSADGDSPVACVMLEVTNGGLAAHTLRVSGFAAMRGSLPADVHARYHKAINALVASNGSNLRATRCFGLSGSVPSYETTTDFGRVYDPNRTEGLSNETVATGDILGCLQAEITLAPDSTTTLAFVCATFADDELAAISAYETLPPAQRALDDTISYLQDVLGIAEVITPDKDINDGVLWSKVNMRRVMSRYAGSEAFTNEPGVSSNVVGRDGAWFVYGNDSFLPHFSRSLLNKFAEVQYPGGKIPEFYNALTDEREDRGLNINDDTPLFILAVNHHYRATGDIEWLRSIYPSVVLASTYIMSQVDERGLVFCSSRDPRGNVWAIAGWRNVIDGYTLNGAVTEINAECAAALRAAAHLSDNLGDAGSNARTFAAGSAAIVHAMTEHLINPDTGLYYLNIDADGGIHTDVTADELFPVMFRVCDEDTGFRIISRLNEHDFWTAAGLRTISRHDPNYDPATQSGLLGGVWPGLTWWYAFAAARYHPEYMVQALSASFKHYAADPKTNNTVPGQFNEYFDGESLINRGMRLSPWEPPRFLWAAIEGVCGFMLTTGSPRINPLVPPNWKWLAVKRLPYHGREITYMATREGQVARIWSSCDIETELAKQVYEVDVSSDVRVLSANAAVIALRRSDEIMLLVGNLANESTHVPLDLSAFLDGHMTYDVAYFDSQRDAWLPRVAYPASSVRTLSMFIESGGYRLVSLRPIVERSPAWKKPIEAIAGLAH